MLYLSYRTRLNHLECSFRIFFLQNDLNFSVNIFIGYSGDMVDPQAHRVPGSNPGDKTYEAPCTAL